jgi:hypothetical protein
MINISLKLTINFTNRTETLFVEFTVSTNDDGFISREDLLKEINKRAILMLKSKLDIDPDVIFAAKEIADIIRTSNKFNTTVTGPIGWEDDVLFELTSENDNPYSDSSEDIDENDWMS